MAYGPVVAIGDGRESLACMCVARTALHIYDGNAGGRSSSPRSVYVAAPGADDPGLPPYSTVHVI